MWQSSERHKLDTNERSSLITNSVSSENVEKQHRAGSSGAVIEKGEGTHDAF